jgi:hypothetical protein
MSKQSPLKIEASDNSPEAIEAATHYQEIYDGLHGELSKNNAADGNFMDKEATYECALKAFELTQMLSTISKTPEHRTQLRKEISKVIANVQLHADKHDIPSGWIPDYAKRTYKALQKVQKQHMKKQSPLENSWNKAGTLKKALIASAITAAFFSTNLNDNEQNISNSKTDLKSTPTVNLHVPRRHL